MRIATFNANSIRSRLDIVLKWLKTSHTDILCIQETKAQDPDFPLDPFTREGYHVAFCGEKSYNGVAIVSRTSPTAVRFGFDDGKQADETRLVYARFGPLHVINTYVPQGRDLDHAMYAYKLEWFERLRAYFDRHFSARMKVVWAGDLNVAPKPMDIHNSERQQNHVCHHIDVRKAYHSTLDWGFEDVFRKHHPEPGHYSFFDYRFPGALKANRGWRIDHILATPPLARRSTDSFIDLKPRMEPKPSDHTFMVADFDL